MTFLLNGWQGFWALCAACVVPMFRLAPFTDAADAAGGGGAADGNGDGGEGGDGGDGGEGEGQGDGEGDGEEAGAGGATHDDDDELDDDERDREELLQTLTPEEREKRVRTWNRRQARQLKHALPIAERFRDREGRFLPMEEIDRRLIRAREMDEFDEFLRENDDLVPLILDRKNGKKKGRTAAAGGDDDEAFQDPFADETKVPWDTASESGRAFLELFRRGAKENHELKQTLRRLERSLGDVTQRETHRTLAQHEDLWRSAVRAAAAQIPEPSRQAFADAVRGVFEVAKRDRTLGRLNVQQIIKGYLTPFQKAAKGQQRTNAAGQQRRAEGNRTLPRPGGPGRTTVASPQDSNNKKNETIRDARKSFFVRLGMSVPAR